MKSKRTLKLSILVFVAASGSAAQAVAAVTVTSTAGVTSDDSTCSLADAIEMINFRYPANSYYNGCYNDTNGPANEVYLPGVYHNPPQMTVYNLTYGQDVQVDMYINGNFTDQPAQIDGFGDSEIFYVESGVQLDLVALTLRARGTGRTLTNSGTANLNYDTFDNANHSLNLDGGAVWNRGLLNTNLSTFQNCVVTGQGGAIYNTSGGDGGGQLVLDTSTFNNNVALNGGAIANGSPSDYGSILKTHNSTFSNNTATMAGGAIYTRNYAELFWTTIAFNSAGTCTLQEGCRGGGVFSYNNTETRTSSCIIANNTGNNPDYDGTPHGAIDSDLPSLFLSTTGTINVGSDDIVAIDPQLGPLQLNGAFYTKTRAIATTGGAYRGTPCDDGVSYDQRAFPRVGHGSPSLCDVGSYSTQ